MTTYGDLRQWNGEAVGAAGDCIRRTIRRLERAAETMADQAFPPGWSGRGATSAAITRNRLVHFLQIQTRIRGVFVAALFKAEGEVTEIQRLITTLDEEALAHEFRIGVDGSIEDEHDYGSLSFDDVPTWLARRVKLADLVAQRDAIVARAVAVDEALVEAVRQAMDNEDPAGPKALPSQEIQDEWAAMTDDEREEVLRNIAADLAGEYGVTNYSVTFAPLGTGVYGSYDPSTGVITVNQDYLDDPAIISTIVHEMMHAGHDADLDGFPGLTEAEEEELRDNEGNYRPGSGDWEDYRYQPEEHITRTQTDEWIRGLTPDELDQYR